MFDAVGCFYHICTYHEVLPSLSDEGIERGGKKRELDISIRDYVQKKSFTVLEIWACEWWGTYKTTNDVRNHFREHFPYRGSLTEQQRLEEIRKRNLFDDVQCDIEVPENLWTNFSKFPPIFKITSFGKSDTWVLMKRYAEEARLLSQPRKRLIPSFTLQNGVLITPPFLIHLQLGIVCSKTYRFVEYTSKKGFNSFVQSGVDARRQGWRESELHRRRRDNETPSEQYLWLTDYRPQPAHCDEVPQWRKDTCSYQ